MGGLMEEYTAYVSIALIGVRLLKVLITTLCIKLGMKDGHFFPLIFACVCMGGGVGMLIFGYDLGHLAYAAGTVTAACLGVQMKKICCCVIMPFVFPVQDDIFPVSRSGDRCVGNEGWERIRWKQRRVMAGECI